MEPPEFLKTGKKRRLKRQIFCFCGVTEREMSCQHVDVKMRMLGFFLWRNLALFPGGVNQFLIGTFTPVSSLCMILYYYSRWTAQVTSMRGTCGIHSERKCRDRRNPKAISELERLTSPHLTPQDHVESRPVITSDYEQ